MTTTFFSSGLLSQFLSQKRGELCSTIVAMQRDCILNASEEDLCRHLIDRYTLEVPVLNIESKEIVEERTITRQRVSRWGDGRRFDVPGQHIVIGIPFEGDPDLLKYRPSTYVMRDVQGQFAGNEIRLQYQVDESDEGRLQSLINDEISVLNRNVESVSRDVLPYNERLLTDVRAEVAARKALLNKQMNFVE